MTWASHLGFVTADGQDALEVPDPLITEIRRLRTIERAGHNWVDAVVASEDNDEESEEYIDACHALCVALGRGKP